MSKKRQMTKPYVILRDDGTYRVVDLYKHDMDKLKSALCDVPLQHYGFIELSIGIISLRDVREVLPWKEPEASKEPTREEFIASLPADLDAETRQWMIEHVARHYDDPVERGEFV